MNLTDFACHAGPVQVRFTKRHVLVLCPYGHLVTSRELDSTWGGSAFEARVAAHQRGSQPWIVTCYGALSEESVA